MLKKQTRSLDDVRPENDKMFKIDADALLHSD